MSNKLYDFLKFLALMGLPGIATFYGTLSLIWGFPYTDEIVKTIVAIDTLLGAWLGISSYNYNKKIGVSPNEMGDKEE